MNAIDELVEEGARVLSREKQQAAAAEAERQAKIDLELEQMVEALKEATGADDDLLTLLNIKLRSNHSSNFGLSYLGEEAGVSVGKGTRPFYMNQPEPKKYGAAQLVVEFGSEFKAETPRASLAKFVAQAKRKYEISRAELLKTLDAEDLQRFGSFLNQGRAWLDADVQAAAVRHLLAHVPEDKQNDYAFSLWLDNTRSLKSDDAHLAETMRDVEQRLATRKKREHLLGCIKRREDPEVGFSLDRLVVDYEYYDRVPLTRESLDTLWQAAHENGMAEDVDVIMAMAGLENELSDHLHAVERNKQREAIELASFRPFRYYEVRYSMLGESDSGEEREVDWDSFAVLREQPDADGFYHTTTGNVIKPRNVIAVLRHEIVTAEAWRALTWSRYFKQPTDFGEIRVVPNDAEELLWTP